MQCTNPIWVSTIHSPPQSQKPNPQSTKLSIPLPSHVNSVTSPSNPFVKHCLKLRLSSSYRHSHGSALVVGTTPIREIFSYQKSLRERFNDIECLLLLDGADAPNGLDSFSGRVVRVSSLVMKKLSGLQSIESIQAIAVMRIPSSFYSLDDNEHEPDFQRAFPSAHRILVLEGIQDPGNLGTLLRSALAFQWGGVFLLRGCCDPFNEKALRASRGAAFQLPIVSGSWSHLEALRKQFEMNFLAGHPDSSNSSNLVSRLSQNLATSLADRPLCLILGSEGTGLSRNSMEVCDLVSIPMAGEFESLNVSVAGGIFLFMLQPSS